MAPFNFRTLQRFGMFLLLSAASATSYADPFSSDANVIIDPQQGQQGQQGQTPPPASIPQQAPAPRPEVVPDLPEPNLLLQDRIEQPLLPPGSGLDSFGPPIPSLDALKGASLMPPLRRGDSGPASAIEESPAARVVGEGATDLQALQEIAETLREMDGVQRINPMEDDLFGGGGGPRIPGQGLPGSEPDLLGSTDLPGMPSLGLPDNRSTRPSSWIGGSQSPRDAAGGIAGQSATAPVEIDGEADVDAIVMNAAGYNHRARYGGDNPDGSSVMVHESADGTTTVWVTKNSSEQTVSIVIVENDRTPNWIETRYHLGTDGSVLKTFSTPETRAGDNPNFSPSVRFRRGFTHSHTEETYAGGGSGVNPLTGQSTRQPKQHPDQVNPDRTGLADSLGGTYIRAGDDLVINPDPNLQQQTQNPNPEEFQRRLQEGEGPGGIPQAPGTGPEAGGVQ